MRVGLIGAGRMGGPIAQRIQRSADHTVTVLARNEPAARVLRDDGFDIARSVASATKGADVVVVVVFDDRQVREVCLGDHGVVATAEPDSVLAIHTTGRPDTAVAIAQAGADKRLRVLDVPVSGGPDDIARGTITLFAGGASNDLERARAVLSCYGSPIVHAGPLGHGQRLKLVNNALFAANLGLAADVVRFGAALGLDEQTVLTGVVNGSGARPAAPMLAAAGGVGPLAAALGEFLGKDIATVRALAEELAVDLGSLGQVLDANWLGSG